jgi:16S rRNA (cytosine967-C5)-methyltransferase
MDRIPARAAIDESVELAKQAGHRFASAMVNAVLRKLVAAPRVNPPAETVAHLALAESHPAWMVERWASLFGLDAARVICLHGQSQPSLVVRLANNDTGFELSANGIVLQPGQLLTNARTVVSGDIAASAAFQEGHVRMQDEGSQLVAELAAANLDRNTKNILDACAAPGGKTLILAERNLDARILACESSPQRLEQLRQRLAAYSNRIECRLADTTQLNEDADFDLVLADVPCSGTGTLGRNPEIRYRLRPEDLPRQAERQRAILTAALHAVRPGGRVVYSTCSLEPEENQQVVAAVLAAIPNARQISLHASIESLLRESILTPASAPLLQAALTPEGALRLLPGAFHTDGFFIALIEKLGGRATIEA